MNVRFHAEAKREYHEAIGFYRTIDSIVADDFVFKVEDALQIVSARPLTFPAMSGGERRYLLKRFPFGVYYTIESEKQIVVWAVAHLSREPGYWKSRRT